METNLYYNAHNNTIFSFLSIKAKTSAFINIFDEIFPAMIIVNYNFNFTTIEFFLKLHTII